MFSELYPNLSRLINNKGLWESVLQFDKILDRAKSNLSSKRNDPNLSTIAHLLNDLAYNHFFTLLVFRYKAKEIARGIEGAELSSNYLVLFNLARAFLEHTASISYVNHALEKSIIEIGSKQNFDEIEISIKKHIDIVERIYYSGKKDSQNTDRIHVNDLLKALSRVDSSIVQIYQDLCEYVHPNFGSNTVVSSGTISTGSIGVNSDLFSTELSKARDAVEKCADISSDLVFSETKHLTNLEMWKKNAIAKDAKISQLFSVRTSRQGDGKTKDTAIFFVKARTHREAIDAFYKYIKNEKLVLYRRQLAAVDQDFIFDIALTDKGNIWVKYKMDVN